MFKKIAITTIIILSFVGFLSEDGLAVLPDKADNVVTEQVDKEFTFENQDNKNAINEDNFAETITSKKHKEPSIFDIFSSLVFVILLILLTGWVYMKFKKINPEQLLSGKFNKLNENNFKIISSMQLGAGKSIYLIEINDKQLVVGTTASNINLLTQFDKQEEDSTKEK